MRARSDRWPLPAVLVWFGLCLALPAGAAEDASPIPPDLEELRDCMSANLPDQSSIQEVMLRVTDRSGSSRDLDAKIWWNRFKERRSRALIRIQAPEDVRGSAMLMIERDDGSGPLQLLARAAQGATHHLAHDVGLALSGATSPTRTSAASRAWPWEGAKAKRLPGQLLEGRAVEVFEQLPASDSGSQYERTVTYVTKDDCILFRTDFFEPGGELRKVMTATVDDLVSEGDVKLPRHITMEDKLAGTHSKLTIEKAEMNVPIKRKTFEITNLERSTD